ncbi:hypothetical protein OEW28_05955 [Defluviimonas sp. WL0002]|uniref:Uncharacterized protein n=1 Tax=Albidovulum marisflavi TaxID=2984159 RepID=A0ABT2ZAK3_9RHOB|nr:hypothetical protein [Defluviimonas sp. WL0002]MCV2868168.1 hypothetical protein [Defluviimonas sp. WL0002]
MTPEATEELKSMVPVARKRALGFGVCLGKKPEGTVMVLHRMKEPAILARQAKKEGETPKVTFGTVEIKGKKMMLQCQGDILPGMSKNLRKFLAGLDLKLKIVALDADGNVADDDGEPEEEGDQDQVETAEAQSPEAQNWAKIAPAMTAMVERALNAGHEKAPQIEAAWNRALEAAEAGNHQEALAIAAKLRPLLSAQQPQQQAPESNAPEGPDAKRWGAVAGAIGQLYEKAMALNPENRSQLSAAWAMATEKAEAGDFAAALQIATRLKSALEAAISKGGSGTEREVPKDVVPFQKSRVLWGATRSTMMKEMAKLESAIVSVCAGDPELAPIAAEASELRKRLDVFDARLEDVLDRITNTPEGDQRSALKVEARAAIRDYSSALESDFFAEVDDDNGFVQVAVAASARKALDAIAKVLG